MKIYPQIFSIVKYAWIAYEVEKKQICLIYFYYENDRKICVTSTYILRNDNGWYEK